MNEQYDDESREWAELVMETWANATCETCPHFGAADGEDGGLCLFPPPPYDERSFVFRHSTCSQHPTRQRITTMGFWKMAWHIQTNTERVPLPPGKLPLFLEMG